MATTTQAKPRRKSKRLEDTIGSRQPVGPVSNSQWSGFVQAVQKNPMLYLGVVLFIGIAFVAGLVINLSGSESQRMADTAYARALDAEEPAIQASQLESVAAQFPSVAAEATYMAGEAHYSAGNAEEAEAAFSAVRSDYSGSPYVARATEGLGYIAEDRGSYEEALAFYEEAAQSGDSFTARRQAYNIGRVKERLEDYVGAMAAYEEQQTLFPGSSVATNAGGAASRLRTAHPDLFPDETASDPALESVVEDLMSDEPEVESADESSGDELPEVISGEEVTSEEADPAETPQQ